MKALYVLICLAVMCSAASADWQTTDKNIGPKIRHVLTSKGHTVPHDHDHLWTQTESVNGTITIHVKDRAVMRDCRKAEAAAATQTSGERARRRALAPKMYQGREWRVLLKVLNEKLGLTGDDALTVTKLREEAAK